MNFLEAAKLLLDGKCIQNAAQPMPWCYLKAVNGEPHWFGFDADPDAHFPYSSSGWKDDWVEVDEAEARARKPAGTHRCGRRGESWQGRTEIANPDHYRQRNGESYAACSYCGSMSGDEFMAGVEDGSIVVGPTDKNYKAYLYRPYTEADVARLREQWKGIGLGQAILEKEGEAAYNKWFDEEQVQGSGNQFGKFYFQHLSEPQKMRFIELLNAKKVKIGMPGYFYRTPFFITYEKRASDAAAAQG